jgi:hypothetical protein
MRRVKEEHVYFRGTQVPIIDDVLEIVGFANVEAHGRIRRYAVPLEFGGSDVADRAMVHEFGG